MLASSDVMQPLRQAYVASGLGQGLRHLRHFQQNNGFGNRPRERPERPWSHRKCPSGDPGAFWSVSAASGRCPSDLRGTPEAAPKPPSTAPGVPQGAQGTPKDAAEAPRAASAWLFLVAKGLLDSSPALLQKSTFSYVNSMVLEGSGPPESSLGALGSVAVVSFGASLRRFEVFGSLAQGLGALWGTGPAVLGALWGTGPARGPLKSLYFSQVNRHWAHFLYRYISI